MIENYSELEIAYIIQQKESGGFTWEEISESFNKKFKKDKHFESIKKCYQRHKEYFSRDDNYVKTLKDIHSARKRSSYSSKENKSIIDQWVKRDDLIDTVENTIKRICSKKYSPKNNFKYSKQKKNMTLELLFSDVHYGKYVDDIEGNYVDLAVIRKRVKKIAESLIKEVHRESKSFNVQKILLVLLGDMIENADFHDKESTKGCEFSTSMQVSCAIESIWADLLLPVASLGIPVHVPCITGNHDRISRDKTYVKPGEDNLSYIIYKSLQALSKASGLTNVTFDITSGLYTHAEVYGNVIIWEHGDEVKNTNRVTLQSQMNKRQAQIGKIAHFYRIGHFHDSVQYGHGTIMVNGSVPGQDGYAESKGFDSDPIQILNYYIQTDKRDTCFFRSFPIQLKNKEDSK